jgi:hypothetical protein
MKPSEEMQAKDFSIVLGGPFFQLLRKAHLTGNALELIKKRIIIISLLTWLPLLVLCILNGMAWGENTQLPFIEDFEVHIRFLFAIPLMIVAELLVHQRIQLVVKQFEERQLIPDSSIAQFRNAIASAYRLRNSFFAEFFILVLIYVIGYNVVWNKSMAVATTAWYSEPALGNSSLSLAGVWFRYVSLPLFQFLLLRWYYRIFIWARFLFQVSRNKLNLIPTHPDCTGGLGFLSNTVFAFMPLAVVHGAVIAGMIANHIFQEGAVLLDFKIELIVIAVVVLCLVLLPLFFFSGQLSDTKRMGGLAYGQFAYRYAHRFDARWVQGDFSINSPDCTHEISGLGDLSNSFNVIQKMQVVPIVRNDIIMLVIATLAPVLPLVLTMMPLSELLKMLSGVLF